MTDLKDGGLRYLAFSPGPLGGERKDGERNAVASVSALGIGSEKAH